MQVVGFTDADAHKDVLAKGAKGLGIECGTEILLVCSNGIVLDMPILGKQWTLGEFIQQNGGTANRSKKVWGVLCPYDEEGTSGTSNTVSL